MQVVETDNYNRETVPERTLIIGIAAHHAHKIAELMNEAAQEAGQDMNYYRVEPDDYKLWRGMADLV